jgi:flagellar secretion chaperone FliS
MMNPYKNRALEGASGVELTIALYDGIIRFMHCAVDAVERGDTHQRRAAVKRAMDVILYLQATLKPDIGGKPAEALSEFYIAMFALMLQGSQANSRKKFEAVIANVWNVREAWRQVAQNPVGPGVSPLAAVESQPPLARIDRSKSADGMFPARWTA